MRSCAAAILVVLLSAAVANAQLPDTSLPPVDGPVSDMAPEMAPVDAPVALPTAGADIMSEPSPPVEAPAPSEDGAAVESVLDPITTGPALAPISLTGAGVGSAAALSAPTYPAAPGYAPGPISGVQNAAPGPGYLAGAEVAGVDTSQSACFSSNCGETCVQAQARISASSRTTLPVLLQVGSGSNTGCTNSSQFSYTCCEETCSTNTDCSSEDYCGTAPGSTSPTSDYCFSCNCTTGSPTPGVSNDRCKQECAVAYAAGLVGNTTNTTSCFPGSALVSTPFGMLSMDRLRIGDQVLTLKPSGEAVFEKVFMFSHRAHNEAAMYVNLIAESGHSIAATPGHYVWAAKPGQKTQLTRAASVEVGDELLTSALAEGDREMRSPVMVITNERFEGLFNPHTASGNIVVNGVAAAAFTDVLPPSLTAYKAVVLPFKAMAAVMPSNTIALAINDAVLNAWFAPWASSGPRFMRSMIGGSSQP